MPVRTANRILCPAFSGFNGWIFFGNTLQIEFEK
jgi:hypothetical protein